MLDSDLTRIYKCANGTKTINLAVRRHINRFQERFMFQLTDEEIKNLRFQFETSKKENNQGGRRYCPYAFTGQGIAMLATVLRTPIAEEVSIKIMDAFVKMRHYVSNESYRLYNIETKIIEHDNSIKLLQQSFDKLNEKSKVNKIFYQGQVYDAYSLLLDILNKAKEEIILIDNYAGKELLDILKEIDKKIIIVSSNIDDILKKKYELQYNNVEFINNNTFHDRFIIIDRSKLYSCGASFKDLGKKCFSIHEIESKYIINNFISRMEDKTNE